MLHSTQGGEESSSEEEPDSAEEEPEEAVQGAVDAVLALPQVEQFEVKRGGRKGGKLFQVERFVRLEKTRTLLRETSARTRRRGKKSVVGIIGIARRRRRKRVDAIDVYFHFLDVNTFKV